jgi:hypothetical protein
MNEQQYSQARDLGEQARRAGKSRESNPYKHGSSSDLRDLREAWNHGFNLADLERRGGR